jgi:transcriptional regulator with XRE-family HTH domain
MSGDIDLGLAIQIHRDVEEMSQKDLAMAAGVSDKTISSWKTGRRRPKQDPLTKVVDALQVPFAEIQETAAFIGRIRLRSALRRQAASGSAPPEEAAPPPKALSDDELHRQIGCAYALLAELKVEVHRRKTEPQASADRASSPARRRRR